MKKHISLVGALATLFLGMSISAFSGPGSNESVAPNDTMFGIMRKDRDGKWHFEETTHIPNKPGTFYRWYLNLNTTKEEVTLKQELTLPEPPALWEGDGQHEMRISDDRRTAMVEYSVSPQSGWISAVWQLTEGDPAGKYTFKIYVDEQLVNKFLFFVEDPAAATEEVVRNDDWYYIISGVCQNEDPGVMLIKGQLLGVRMDTKDIVKEKGKVVSVVVVADDGSAVTFYRGFNRCQYALNAPSRRIDDL